MAGPPLPPGFQFEDRGNFDPIKPMLDAGVEIQNGYRTPEDVQRLRRQGYTPADNGAHNRGDAVDLTPGKTGWDLPKLADYARQQFGPDAQVAIHNGTHVHVSLKGWGKAPGTPGSPYSGIPDLPPGFQLQQRGSLQGANLMAGQTAKPTGQLHDGDTFQLSTGGNGRLEGVDAFELTQTAHSPSGAVVPLGVQARDALSPFATPQGTATGTGASTYNRPVVTLDNGGDAGQALLRQGLGLAEPQYLRGDPQRFGQYMEAERQARMNLLGAHGNTYETPSAFRHGAPDPWAQPEAAKKGEPGQAVFADEPTPFEGLRPDIAKGYLAIWDNPKSTPADLVAYATANGFTIDPAKTAKAYARRDDPRYKRSDKISYQLVPKPLIDPGDGRFGTTMRGVGDPFNAIDELGGVVDTVGGTSGRENLFNSDRRFGDILANNIDQNRAIIGHDEATHPNYRLGGQIAGSLAIPLAGEMTVPRLAAVGAIEGGLAGFGAGEGNVAQRLPGAVLGAGAGAVLGPAVGLAGEHLVAPVARRGMAAFNRLRGRGGANAEVSGVAAAQPVSGTAPSVTDTPESLPAVRSAGMAMDQGPELVGPAARQPDRIDVGSLPPMPDGFALEEPSLGRTPKMGERPSAEAIANSTRIIAPEDVISTGANRIGSMEEAAKANPGRFAELQAPNELDALPVRTVTTSTGGKVKVRGPLDITQSLRLMGGVRDDGGDLAHLGIDNAPRRMDFGSNEQFLGKLINNDSGMSLDDAALRLWEEGYFPGARERPTPNDLLDRLHDESTGAHRYFHPDDLSHIEDFHAAQAERGRIAEADAAGSPLVEERGQPATQADMEANAPPATAYEDLPTLGGKVGNINLSRVETKDDISRLLKTTESRMGGFDAAKRGTITHAETDALASELNMTAADLLKRRQGQALNAEQALAARRILAKSADEVVALARKVRGGSDEEIAAFHRAMVMHAAIQEQVTGATAEAGRALAQYKMIAHAKDHRGRILKAVIDGVGGKHSLEEAADAIIDLQREPGALNKFVQDATKPSWKDKAVELWYNSLLSGPQTHAVNILSNALTAAAQIPEYATAAGIGMGRAAAAKMRGKEATERVLGSEIGARTVGLLQGAHEGLRAFKHTLATGDVPDFITKVESARHEAIGGIAGTVIRTPTRMLSAEDEFFKATARRMEIAGLATRKAASEGLRGPARRARIAELTRNPTDEMVQKSMDYARYLTFQRPLGPSMRHVQAIVQQHPWLKLFVPFIRTPTNLLKFAVERSPAAPLLKEVRADFKAGGAARDLAVAKMGLGTGLGLSVAQWAADGVITGGGPADENVKRLKLQQGWQPYSVRIGGKYYSYRRLDPISTTLGVVADMVDLQSAMTNGQREKVVPLVVAGIVQNLENKTWLSGLSDLFGAISDPMQNGKHFIERLAGSVAVPAIVAQSARTLDPVARQTSSESMVQGAVDSIKSRIPGLSERLYPKRDMWGDPITNEGGLGPNIVSPIWTSRIKDDPAARAAQESGAVIGPVSRLVKGGKLPDAQFDQYSAYAGQLSRQYVAAAMNGPDWKGMNAGQRKAAIESAVKSARADARTALFQTQAR